MSLILKYPYESSIKSYFKKLFGVKNIPLDFKIVLRKYKFK